MYRKFQTKELKECTGKIMYVVQYKISLTLLWRHYQIPISLVKTIQKQHRIDEINSSYVLSKVARNELNLSLSPYTISINYAVSCAHKYHRFAFKRKKLLGLQRFPYFRANLGWFSHSSEQKNSFLRVPEKLLPM